MLIKFAIRISVKSGDLMFRTLFKRKVSEEKLVVYFINSTIEMVDSGFGDVAELINQDPCFVESPNIQPNQSDQFLLIVLAGNIKLISNHFESIQDRRILNKAYNVLSHTFDLPADEVQKLISNYQSYISKVNFPSKNTLYGMSKAVFYKYGLNDFQEPYFKNMKAPNPLFIKRLDSIIEKFIWDWTEFQEKYKIVER